VDGDGDDNDSDAEDPEEAKERESAMEFDGRKFELGHSVSLASAWLLDVLSDVPVAIDAHVEMNVTRAPPKKVLVDSGWTVQIPKRVRRGPGFFQFLIFNSNLVRPLPRYCLVRYAQTWNYPTTLGTPAINGGDDGSLRYLLRSLGDIAMLNDRLRLSLLKLATPCVSAVRPLSQCIPGSS
jgi:hypothetical protein